MTALLLLSFVSLVALSLGSTCMYTNNDTLDATSPDRCQVNMDCMCPYGLTWLPAHQVTPDVNCQSAVTQHLPWWNNDGEASLTCANNVTKQIPGDTANCYELLQAVGTIYPRYCCGSATVEPGRLSEDIKNQTEDIGTMCDLDTGCKLGRNSFLNEISQSNSSCWDASNKGLVQTCECVNASFYFAQDTSGCSIEEDDAQWFEMLFLVENTCQECTKTLQTCAISHECDLNNSNVTESCECYTNILTCMTNTSEECSPGNSVYDRYQNVKDQNCDSKCSTALDDCFTDRGMCESNQTRPEACFCWTGIVECMDSSDCDKSNPLLGWLQDEKNTVCATDAPTAATAAPTAKNTETPKSLSSSVQTTVSVACLLVTMVLMVTVL